MSFSIPRTCAFCEHFDGGGEKLVNLARAGQKIEGDCHCSNSPRFTTASDDTCPQFMHELPICSTTVTVAGVPQ